MSDWEPKIIAFYVTPVVTGPQILQVLAGCSTPPISGLSASPVLAE